MLVSSFYTLYVFMCLNVFMAVQKMYLWEKCISEFSYHNILTFIFRLYVLTFTSSSFRALHMAIIHRQTEVAVKLLQTISTLKNAAGEIVNSLNILRQVGEPPYDNHA